MAQALVRLLRTRRNGRSSGAGDETYGVANSAGLKKFAGKCFDCAFWLDRAAKTGKNAWGDREVLTAAAKDVREGLLETVGVDSPLSLEGERCLMILHLPEGTDTEKIARAIDLENIET